MLAEIGDGVTYIQEGGPGDYVQPIQGESRHPYPFLADAIKDPRVKGWWQNQRRIFESLNPFDLAQKFRDRGAKAEVSIGRCLTLGIADAPPVTVSFSRAAMVYGFLFLG